MPREPHATIVEKALEYLEGDENSGNGWITGKHPGLCSLINTCCTEVIGACEEGIYYDIKDDFADLATRPYSHIYWFNNREERIEALKFLLKKYNNE